MVPGRRAKASTNPLFARRTRTAARNLLSIATRTLAVWASLWSSSLSVSVSPFATTPAPSSRSISVPWVAAFAARPHRHRHRISTLRSAGCRHSFHQYWEPDDRRHCHRSSGRRLVHGSAPSPPPTTTSLRTASNGDDYETAAGNAASAGGVGDHNHDKVETTRHLPRLFIDASPSFVSSSSDDDDGGVVIPLREKSLVPLTADQEHYLLDVMRITNPKRWGQRGNILDYTGCVRVFNGVDGEWLAKVVVAEDSASGTKHKKQRRKRGGKQTDTSERSSGTVLECLERLLPQERTIPSSSSLPLPAGTTQDEAATAATADNKHIVNVQLYLGYLKDKQRRRWVVEKATELGADSIAILDTDFSNNNSNNPDSSGYKKKNKEFRWEEDRDKHRLHAIEAAEQCERLTIPELSPQTWSVQQIADRVRVTAPHPMEENDTDGDNCNTDGDIQHVWMVCRERSESSPPILTALREILSSPATATRDVATATAIVVHVLVGPEGGWSPRELELFSELQDVRFVSLGGSVLRAETAAITAVAAVQMYRETVVR